MRASYLVCAAALAFAAATLRGQPVPFSESRATAHHAGIRASTPLVTAEPGTVLTTVFVITNNSTDSLVVLGALGTPKEWTLLAPPFARRLGPQEKDTWIVSVAIPPAASAAHYALRATVVSGSDSSSATTQVTVAERRAVSLTVAESRVWSPTDRPYAITFSVQNRGNVQESLSLSARSSLGQRTNAEPRQLLLAPGAAARIVVRVDAAAKLDRTVDDLIELLMIDGTSTGRRVVASSRVTLVPTSPSTQRVAVVPGELSLRSAQGLGGAPLGERISEQQRAVAAEKQVPNEAR